MKRITIEVAGDTESVAGEDTLRRTLRALATELATPGMVGGRQEIGGLTVSWSCEVVDLPAVLS